MAVVLLKSSYKSDELMYPLEKVLRLTVRSHNGYTLLTRVAAGQSNSSLRTTIYSSKGPWREYTTGSGRYHHILVDEFQDINPLDLALLKAVAAINKAKLTIVGDDDHDGRGRGELFSCERPQVHRKLYRIN